MKRFTIVGAGGSGLRATMGSAEAGLKTAVCEMQTSGADVWGQALDVSDRARMAAAGN